MINKGHHGAREAAYYWPWAIVVLSLSRQLAW